MKPRTSPSFVLALVVLASCGDLREKPVSRADGGIDSPSSADSGPSDSHSSGDAAPDAVIDGGTDAFCAADVGEDPENCGRCGHSCLGGTCVASKCQPLLFDVTPTRFLSLTDQTIFQSAVGGTHIMAVPIGGGTRMDFIVPAPNGAASITNSGGLFYWVVRDLVANATSVTRTPFTDGNPPITGPGATTIYTAPTGFTIEPSIVPPRKTFFSPQDVQLAGSHICVAATDNDTSVSPNARLACMNLDGSGPVDIVTGGLIGPFIMDSTNVYFTFAGPGSAQQISQYLVTGGPATDLTNLPGTAPDTIGTDGRYVWFADPTQSQIVRLNVGASLQAGVPIFQVPSNDAISAIFADDTYVYWLENVDYREFSNQSSCSAVILYRKIKGQSSSSAPEEVSIYSAGTGQTPCAMTAAWDTRLVVFSAGDYAGGIVLMAL